MDRVPISCLLDDLVPSGTFSTWLALVAGLSPSHLKGQHVTTRRFHRGLDYNLVDQDAQLSLPQLDYTLDISPERPHGCVDLRGLSNPLVDLYTLPYGRISDDKLFHAGM